ncbi:MAG: T9SS type A sorting domain-containing protein [Flavobacteriales bacterium]|nr:T9SS type A sorting domain-containing protein [Flavobacteriales bacterium]
MIQDRNTASLFATGRKLESRTLGEGYEGQQLFDTRRLSSGVYLYHIVQEGKKVSEGKFIVTH